MHVRLIFLEGRHLHGSSSHIRSGFRSNVELATPNVGRASGGRFRRFYHRLTWPHGKEKRISCKNNMLLSRLLHSSVRCLISCVQGEGIALMLKD
ncbi:hypothetical protein AVEN_177939-1 [Araneus ventricosus]|uniref:Uncharacterized protein n=1 Tax=Araneus ventricosus TaxID=182803 RepID=A0A4Y2QVY2_ARAVE|nr:hypothetical protein AVEN_177939-1 [Araneus ventricosus]